MAPTGLYMDSSMLFIVDSGCNNVRRMTATALTTVAGDGSGTPGNVDGMTAGSTTATNVARLRMPVDVIKSQEPGSVYYITDMGNNKVSMGVCF